MPAGQAAHAVEPLAVLNVPGMQLVHTVKDALINLPKVHDMHDVDESCANLMPIRLLYIATLQFPSTKPAVVRPDTRLRVLVEDVRLTYLIVVAST